MSPEKSRKLVVFNRRSGNGTAGEIAACLEARGVEKVEFTNFTGQTEMIHDYDMIYVAGGDGTGLWTAEIARQAQKQCTLINRGGFSIVSKMMGSAQIPGESDQAYANRLLTLKQKVAINPGVITVGKKPARPFAWSGGGDFLNGLLDDAELFRFKYPRNPPRRFLNVARLAFTKRIHELNPLRVMLNWQYLGTYSEASVIKQPFVPSILKTHGKDALFLLPYPEDGEVWRTLMLTFLSALTLPFNVRIKGGMEAIPLERGQLVTVTNAKRQPHIDSELQEPADIETEKDRNLSFSIQASTDMEPYIFTKAA